MNTFPNVRFSRSAFARGRWLLPLLLLSGFGLRQGEAQLAITEVMTSAALPGAPDYIELTHFGSTELSLDSFWIADANAIPINLGTLGIGTRVAPGTTLLFVRRKGPIGSAADVLRWWGEASLPAGLQISVADWSFGLDAQRDAVNLWAGIDGPDVLIDHVDLLDSAVGESFTYDPETGQFGVPSEAGVGGAFRSATTNDVGSPGWTTGPVPLRIAAAPGDTNLDGGEPLTWSVQVNGLPRAWDFQWYFNGEPIPGEVFNTYFLANVRSEDAGEYFVEVSNGVDTLRTTAARLTVNLTPRCVAVISPPADLSVTYGQSARFAVAVRGYPPARFQWRWNGINIPGAISNQYSVDAVDGGKEGIYSVHVENDLCATNVSARLTLVAQPHLALTEVMALPWLGGNGLGKVHNDWWELTNLDTNSVNLHGYRWNDNPSSLARAVTITNDVLLRPGQSAIFVASLTPAEFKRWWGDENLPTNLPIISYSAHGFASTGDSITLWNPTASEDADYIWQIGFVNSDWGISLWFDPLDAESEFGVLSVDGERGAFRAVESGDIGSPGWTSNDQRVVRPRVTSIRREGGSLRVAWTAQPGRTYELHRRAALGLPGATMVARLTAVGDTLSALDVLDGHVSQQFYTIVLLP